MEAERADFEVKYQQLNNSNVFTEEVLHNVLNRPELHDHSHLLNTTFINEIRSRSSAAEGDSNGVHDPRVKGEANGLAVWPKVEPNDVRSLSPAHPVTTDDDFLAPFASTTPRREKSRRLTRTTTELLNETAGNPSGRYF